MEKMVTIRNANKTLPLRFAGFPEILPGKTLDVTEEQAESLKTNPDVEIVHGTREVPKQPAQSKSEQRRIAAQKDEK